MVAGAAEAGSADAHVAPEEAERGRRAAHELDAHAAHVHHHACAEVAVAGRDTRIYYAQGVGTVYSITRT